MRNSLRAMNLSDDLIEGALRIGVGKFTTDTEIEKSSEMITNTVEKILQLTNISD